MSKTEIDMRRAAIQFMRDVTKMNPKSTPRSCIDLLQAVRASQDSEEREQNERVEGEVSRE